MSETGLPKRIAERYEVHDLLGQGGMARVFHVTDLTSGRDLALKQLLVAARNDDASFVAALFEREFHTLSQLSHPRVIAVYDYGVADDGPYYTMELLDGGDLRQHAPLPWRQACSLMFDVCSSLALLHSRRLLHRDVSPRNVRCTRAGQAKLIDFGAMVPIGPNTGQLVGTPAFTPPEAVQRSALDARTDLYSLGATLYYALTGRLAYPARDFSDVLQAWSAKPAPPSTYAPDIPAALDDLCAALLNLEPALRPQSAYEVMQRLAACADLPPVEAVEVSRAYLSAPLLVGRNAVISRLRERLRRAMVGRGGGLLLRGGVGLGRSRMLDAGALEAKTLGATVVRTACNGDPTPFAVAIALMEHLLEGLNANPASEQFAELFEPHTTSTEAAPGFARLSLHKGDALRADRERFARLLCDFLLVLSRTRPLLIAVDDLERIDEPSAAVLAALVDRADRGNLLVLMTAVGEADAEPGNLALEVLARRSELLTLEPLTRAETGALFGSIFGDAPNLDGLADAIDKLASGNPRLCMDVAQHLVDKELIRYQAGTWVLPTSLAPGDLPASADDAMRARIARLSPLAKQLAEACALAFHEVFEREDLQLLWPELDDRALDGALCQLVFERVLSDTRSKYVLADRVWSAALLGELSAERGRQHHEALARLYRGKSGLAFVYHLFEAGLDEQGLDALNEQHAQFDQAFDVRSVVAMNTAALGRAHEQAIRTACALDRPARQLYDLKRWLVALSTTADDRHYWSTAPDWLAQLKHDCGLDLLMADPDHSDPQARLIRALTAAQQRYEQTPEHERVYRVDEAIRGLAEYVAFSIAIGARAMDMELFASLPALLEPFASLSPVIDALWQNALATCESSIEARVGAARARWHEVYAKLCTIQQGEMQHVESLRSAVAYAIGQGEATLGMPSALTWADRLDADPRTRISAMYIRKIVCLEQGDWAEAERLRRQAENASLRSPTRQMFTSQLAIELATHALARDLVGLKDVLERMAPLAQRYPGWRPFTHLAQARFELVRGDFGAALREFDACIALTTPLKRARACSLQAWLAAHAGRAEACLGLGETEQGYETSLAALELLETNDATVNTSDLVRSVALCEAKRGDHARAIARTQALIERLLSLGVSGLRLGLAYEVRAQIAIWNGDQAAFTEYARLTALEYHYGSQSPLSGRYERLLNEARRHGLPLPSGFAPTQLPPAADDSRVHTQDVSKHVTEVFTKAKSPQERSRRALRMVCESRGAAGGHLYLVRGEHLQLVASFELPTPPDALLQRANEHVARERDRADTLTVVDTSTQHAAPPSGDVTVRVAGVSYDLLPLICPNGNTHTLVGVIAAGTMTGGLGDPRQRQLLAAVASEMFKAGDSLGVPA